MMRTIVVCLVFFWTLGAGASAGSSDASHVRIGVPERDATSVTYLVHIDGPTEPLIVVLPHDAVTAQLTRGAHTQTSSRNATSAFGPLGHALPSFRLDDVHAGERIAVRIQPASASAPRVIGNVDIIAQAESAARITGIVFGILLAVAIWQSTLFWFGRDLTLIPFLIAIATRAAIEAVRGGIMPSDLFGSTQMTSFVLDVLAGAAEIAFVVGFLRLERRVTRLLIGATLAIFALAIAIVALVPALPPLADGVWGVVRVVAGLALALVAAARVRQGFRPAAFILISIAGNILCTLYLVVLNRNGALLPPLDPWMFQIGTAFPALVLALGIPYRLRFVAGERDVLERDLRVAEFAAEHDPLTGLLNRRGLASWTATTPLTGGCILFIDLDGFKDINDRAGHDAGDRTLIAVARVLSSAVRAGDAVARVGGDEFVVMLDARGAGRAANIMRRIMTDVESLRPIGADARFGASIGQATFGSEPDVERTLAQADADAYRVKAARRTARERSPGGDAEKIAH